MEVFSGKWVRISHVSCTMVDLLLLKYLIRYHKICTEICQKVVLLYINISVRILVCYVIKFQETAIYLFLLLYNITFVDQIPIVRESGTYLNVSLIKNLMGKIFNQL